MAKRNLPLAALPTCRPFRCRLHDAALERFVAGVFANAEGEAGAIDILGPIGGLEFIDGEIVEGTTARGVLRRLREAEGGPVTVNINSPGGDYLEGLAIFNLLREHPGEVTARIIGEAASAASIVAMGADRVEIGKSAFLFVHNVQSVAYGDRHLFASLVETLETLDGVLVDLYQARTGQPRAKVAAMLDKETWLSGSDAVKAGFADALLPADKEGKVRNVAEGPAPMKALAQLRKILAEHGLPKAAREALLKEVTSYKAGGAAMRDAGEGNDNGKAVAAAGLQSILGALGR